MLRKASFVVWAFCLSSGVIEAAPNDVLDAGTRIQLAANHELFDGLAGGARLELHHPVPQEVSLTMDKPWEGSALGYVTVFKDGDIYRMYYRGEKAYYTVDSYVEGDEAVTCYAESRDGIHWTKPNLGIWEFHGSTENNIVWKGIGATTFAPFLDTNPKAPADQRYKAMGAGPDKAAQSHPHEALYAFKSPDGLHWSLLSEDPVITKGAFDSENLAFWDSSRGEYREYHRDFKNNERDIRTGTSRDFVHWTDPVFLEYSPSRVSQLYTNQVIPYYRAPQLFVGFPTRYVDRGWTTSAESLPRIEYRRLRASKSRREGTAVTDGMFMISSDGLHFDLFPESFVRPGLRTSDTWFYGDMYQNWGLVETQSAIEDTPRELSMYFTQSTMQQDRPAYLRRYTLRVDGFVSVQAPLSGGDAVTKPMTFEGTRLVLNYSTSAAGGIRVEIQDMNGKPIPGFALNDCEDLYGDSLEQPVVWKGNPSLRQLIGKPIRLRFELHDADLYSLHFAEKP